MSTTLILGKNHFQNSQALAEKTVGEVRDFDGTHAELDDIISSISSQSLFDAGAESTVVVNEASAHKPFCEWLADNLDTVPASTHLILYDAGFDKRSRCYKAIKKDGEVLESTQLREHELQRWLADYCSSHDIDIDRAAQGELISRVGVDQHALVSELEKFQLLGRMVRIEDVQAMTARSPEDNIFHLLELIFQGKLAQGYDFLDSMDDASSEPVYVVTMILWQLNAIAAALTGESRSDQEIAKDIKMSPFVVGKSRKLVRNLDVKSLTYLYELTLTAERELKGGSLDGATRLRALMADIAEPR